MVTKSVTLRPGNIVSIPDVGEGPITKIYQDRYDRFRIGLYEHDPSAVIGIDTMGKNRVPEQPLPAIVASLTIELFDLVSISGVGTKTIGVIDKIRADRYRLRLEEKYQPSIVIDIDTSRSATEPVTELVDMLGNVLHVGDLVAFARMNFGLYDDRPELVVRAIREIEPSRLLVERDPGESGLDVESPEDVVRVMSPTSPSA